MRRGFPWLLILLLGAGSAPAQVRDKVHRLGVLAESPQSLENLRKFALPEIAKLGIEEGRNLTIEARQGTPERMPELARELVALKPDAIFAVGVSATVAVGAATSSIPIVVFGANPVELGFAESLSRPGKNMTAVVILAGELNAKRLEILHQAIPTARRIAALVEPSAMAEAYRREMRDVATSAGIELLFFDATGPEHYQGAFEAMRAAGAQALAINSSPHFNRDAARLARLALDAGLPTVCQWREMAQQGCLLSYGPRLAELYGRNAEYLGRILTGAAPSTMPIEQPARFELVVNATTAKALALQLSPSLLALADDVID